MKRKVIHIDESLCDGCGLCIPNCPEGAIQIIDEKARLVSDLFCDGLGACLGHCPRGAISIEDREAEPFNETRVMENIIPKGIHTIKAHLDHLLEHGEEEYYREAVAVLEQKGIPVPEQEKACLSCESHTRNSGCPGSQSQSLTRPAIHTEEHQPVSALRHWPVQLHLINPNASHYRGSDLLLAADCTAFALGDFHTKYLKGKTLAIACPKLDQEQEIYPGKILALIEDAHINSITVLLMEVPCCGGLMAIVNAVLNRTQRKIPVKLAIAGIDGDIIREEWVNTV